MKLIKKILEKLNGLHYKQEYLCLSKGSFEQPLYVYTIIAGLVVEDITNQNNFVGYSPVIFALSYDQTASLAPEMISLVFSSNPLAVNEEFSKKDAIASLQLEKINEQRLNEDEGILYYEAIKGHHHFLPAFRQLIINWQNRFQKKPNNVFLPGNLYKQVQIAYSAPRNISLITIRQNDNYNLFPTDLHGPIGDDHYIISLRHEGKACAQVMETKRILLTHVQASFYKTVYSLGKNHMQELRSKEQFPFGNERSATWDLHLPQSAIFYRELELTDSFTHGIHRLMLFKLIHRQQVQPDLSILAHIHNVYATWRYNNRLTGNYLLR